jgi:hypothetical protein
VAMFGLSGRLPDVLWDGYVNAKRAQGPQICIEGASGVLNADGPNKYSNPSLAGEGTRCTLPRLPQVSLPQAGAASTAKAAPSA